MRYVLGWLGVAGTLLIGCGGHSAPSAPAADLLAPSERSIQIQQRLANAITYLYSGSTVVWWEWREEGYAFGQQAEGQLVVWEKGAWWVQDISGYDFLVMDRKEGGQLVQTAAGPQWRFYPPGVRRIPIALLGTSLAAPDLVLEMDIGRIYTYRFAPLDSLEAIKAHTQP